METPRKAQAPVWFRQALEDWLEPAFFAVSGMAEATRGTGRRSLDTKKSAGARLVPTSAKGLAGAGVL